ncbi:hypothetical protein Ade02nite_56270 [Paractinoplanes deccanensis]|uniref:Response regulatory domain-containing protein n=1 Tax=Paractinoplanes deccanensis TaxID=113561 RepID=A0ABQ3YAG3_9ACTN|nr:response regulator transcription factor [Actinoplanes deccanensis]GID76986.1 hypothetical protein Ade02nite_56270 [Actinoplanes deccanensis]
MRTAQGWAGIGTVAVETIRTLIVDDDAAFREGLRALLETADDIEVAGDTADGEQALVVAPRVRPDVVLLDLTLPGMGGTAATERLLLATPGARVLLMALAEDDEPVFEALRAGARGYVLKGAGRAEVLRAVRAVAAGEIVAPAL